MNLDPQDRCDIVMPVWNHLELTRECVESIKTHTAFPYRIVAIDNASDAPTRDYLDSLAKEDEGKVVILRNSENQGFVKAVNQGMKFSDARYVLIMNNDTIVTDGWLEELIEILRRNKDVGIINPSSNSSCQFPGKLTIDAYARTLKAFKGQYQELHTGRAFAMIVKREVIDRIGYLDTSYGMGYFDDTDYCKQAQALGYKAVRAKASYVYHKESQSFSKLKERSAIFLDNETRFTAKWGRHLRVAYVLPGSGKPEDIDRISSNINRIVRQGHQAWLFIKEGFRPRLKLIDHEGIRFFYYPDIFFTAIVLYKIWKRRRKKNLHIILTNDDKVYRELNPLKNILGAGVFRDRDFSIIEKALKELSGERR